MLINTDENTDCLTVYNKCIKPVPTVFLPHFLNTSFCKGDFLLHTQLIDMFDSLNVQLLTGIFVCEYILTTINVQVMFLSVTRAVCIMTYK